VSTKRNPDKYSLEARRKIFQAINESALKKKVHKAIFVRSQTYKKLNLSPIISDQQIKVTCDKHLRNILNLNPETVDLEKLGKAVEIIGCIESYVKSYGLKNLNKAMQNKIIIIKAAFIKLKRESEEYLAKIEDGDEKQKTAITKRLFAIIQKFLKQFSYVFMAFKTKKPAPTPAAKKPKIIVKKPQTLSESVETAKAKVKVKQPQALPVEIISPSKLNEKTLPFLITQLNSVLTLETEITNDSRIAQESIRYLKKQFDQNSSISVLDSDAFFDQIKEIEESRLLYAEREDGKIVHVVTFEKHVSKLREKISYDLESVKSSEDKALVKIYEWMAFRLILAQEVGEAKIKKFIKNPVGIPKDVFEDAAAITRKAIQNVMTSVNEKHKESQILISMFKKNKTLINVIWVLNSDFVINLADWNEWIPQVQFEKGKFKSGLTPINKENHNLDGLITSGYDKFNPFEFLELFQKSKRESEPREKVTLLLEQFYEVIKLVIKGARKAAEVIQIKRDRHCMLRILNESVYAGGSISASGIIKAKNCDIVSNLSASLVTPNNIINALNRDVDDEKREKLKAELKNQLDRFEIKTKRLHGILDFPLIRQAKLNVLIEIKNAIKFKIPAANNKKLYLKMGNKDRNFKPESALRPPYNSVASIFDCTNLNMYELKIHDDPHKKIQMPNIEIDEKNFKKINHLIKILQWYDREDSKN